MAKFSRKYVYSPAQLSFDFELLSAELLPPLERSAGAPALGLLGCTQVNAQGVLASKSVPTASVGVAVDCLGAVKPPAYQPGVHNPLVDRPQLPETRRGRKLRAAYVPATHGDKPVTIYQKLIDYGLLRKLTDIVLHKAAVPWNLREDAKQEVHMAWCERYARPEFARNQLANYAYRSGQHAALKLRRQVGAVVAIPGVLFREGRNHPFMASIGAAVNPHDIDDFSNHTDLSFETGDIENSRVSQSFFNERLQNIKLTLPQLQVAHRILVNRQDPLDVAAELDLELSRVERLIDQVVAKLRKFDAAQTERDAVPPEAGCCQEELHLDDATISSLVEIDSLELSSQSGAVNV